nr:putative zinc finger, CCHC-type [Tanacetum cinerariifolium]
GRTVAVTTEDMQKRRNDVKTFGGNEATKKTKKNLLKQQYGNFKAEGSETLEQTFNRLRNGEVNTASIPTASTQVSPVGPNVATASISLDTACAYIASQSNGSQIKYDDINQIDEYDIKEMDIMWNMALLSMRADKYWKKTGKKISIQENHALVADEEAPTEFALMAKSNTNNEVFDNSLCSKSCKKNIDSLNSKITELSEKLGDTKNMLYHYKLGLSQVEARIVKFKNQEIKFCEKIRGLEFKVESKANRIENLTNELETLKKEKEGLDSKLTGFKSASKDLDNLLETQRSDKNKEGLGYNVVPPPPAQVYSPSKKDMSWTGLPEFADDTITDYSRPSPAIESNSDEFQNRKPSVAETGASSSTILSKPAIKFVKAADRPTETKLDKVETTKKPAVKYAELFRKTSKSTNVRGNQRNWNNLKSHQLGKNFEMKNKACFSCGDFNHLSYDCDKWVE